jgi:peroxiredoxin Q/BCP
MLYPRFLNAALLAFGVALVSITSLPQTPSPPLQAGKPADLDSETLELGKPAPDFSLKDQTGKTHRLTDYKGKTVVLAFYPKDDTPGCTAEMCAFRDALPQFKTKGVVILGVSVQNTISKKAFASKFNLTFPILADTEKVVAKLYKVLGANGLAERITFLIAPDGTLKNVDRSARLTSINGKTMSDHVEALALMLTDDWKVELGKPIPSFTLKNYDGKPINSTSNRHDLTVLAFVSTRCGYSNDYNARLVRFAKEYAVRGNKRVRVIGINANTNEKVDEIAKHTQDNGLPYPVTKDEGNVIADHFRAQKTPEVWVVDRRGVARYHGAIDDHFEEVQVKKTYLRDAVEALLEDKEPAITETEAQGCSIKRERKR